MSTSITQLPGTAAASTPIEDINVLNVIDEMQQVVQQPPIHAPMPMQQAVRMVVQPSPWMDKDRAQRALIAAVIALAIFYPGSMQVIYSKLPRFEGFFASYDLLIRAVLFAVVIYLLLWKLEN